MPHWGFTKEMLETKPFGLSANHLKPGKIFSDPIHGDIHLTRLEVGVVDSEPFQRLRRTKQLGMTHLVYPGATHTRFSHSLGAVRTVQSLLDHAVEQRTSIHPVDDLIGEWEAEGADPEGRRFLDIYLARATVVARLGALLHDICHLPYGHSIEDDMGLLDSHDKNQPRLERIWSQFPADVQEVLNSDRLGDAVRHVIAPKLVEQDACKDLRSPYVVDNPFVGDLVGNTICADLVDYLSRDHAATGLPMALGRRFLSAFFITPSKGNHRYKKRMALSITRDGHERADIATELLKYLRYRYELTERVLTHHAKLRADAMVGVLVSLWKDLLAEESPDDVSERLEGQMLRFGDEGLLEHLRDFKGEPGGTAERISMRAKELLDRDLFEEKARFSGSLVVAEQLDARRRDKDRPIDFREVVVRAAEYVEVDPSKVALWIPPSKMNLKAAGVLVFDGTTVSSFVDYEQDRSQRRGAEIERAHRDLWCARLFAHKDVPDKKCDMIQALVARDLAIPWENLVPSLGQETFKWPDRLMVKNLIDELHEDKVEPISVERVLEAEVQARGAGENRSPQNLEALR
ncbi:MAG: hypothetical protein KDK70_38785, partial [Myxococcales bacterium]|nr:hypothetical protein [Myxococcales bacterium]